VRKNFGPVVLAKVCNLYDFSRCAAVKDSHQSLYTVCMDMLTVNSMTVRFKSSTLITQGHRVCFVVGRFTDRISRLVDSFNLTRTDELHKTGASVLSNTHNLL